MQSAPDRDMYLPLFIVGFGSVFCMVVLTWWAVAGV
jgi:hypothetical protein